MFKIADYLIQCQSMQPPANAAELRPLDTRGAASPLFSLWVLLTALAKIVRGRIDGRLAGVHVNMAERMSLFRKGAVIVACRALGVPVVLHLHAQMHRFYATLPAVLQAPTRWVFSLAKAVVVIGPVARLHRGSAPASRGRRGRQRVPEPRSRATCTGRATGGESFLWAISPNAKAWLNCWANVGPAGNRHVAAGGDGRRRRRREWLRGQGARVVRGRFRAIRRLVRPGQAGSAAGAQRHAGAAFVRMKCCRLLSSKPWPGRWLSSRRRWGKFRHC